MKKRNDTIAIDLLWLRPGKVGGTEFFIRNLLDGFMTLDEHFHFVLLVSKDNEMTFDKYIEDSRFKKIIANVNSANISKRIIWQNFFQNSFLRKHNISKCFVPVYCRPFWNGGISYITVIHDIQAKHYPHYHPAHEVWYSKLCWIVDKYFNKHIIVTSKFVRDDLIKNYQVRPDKISVVNIPVKLTEQEEKWEMIEEKYGIKQKEYYYTIGQMIPHKNMETLIKVFAKIKRDNLQLLKTLVISGISGNATKQINALIEELGIADNIILTGFVSDEAKVALYKNCKAFLFPSVFEGFGIPPVEAMMCGAGVITTKCASIPEVTLNRADYVEDPYGIDDWIGAMKNHKDMEDAPDFGCYSPKILGKKYLDTIYKFIG